MPNNPSTDNYVLGKGILYFNKLDNDTAEYDGMRDLGNAPAVNVNVALEELAHYSSRGGLRAKDKKVISEISPTLTFTLDEQSADNVALLFMATKEAVTQAAMSNLTKTVTVKPNRFYDLGYRGVGVMALPYDAETADFTEGAVLTGGTSGATADILRVIATTGTTGTLWLHNIVGDFEDDEALTDDNGTPGSATANGVPALVTTAVSIPDGASGFYVAGTDFIVDSDVGRIKIPAGSAIPADTELTISFACAAVNYTKLKGLQQSVVEGQLHFISDNPVGTNLELKIWRTSLTPSGDTALIGEDWSTFAFTGEILKDEEGHPDSPYLDLIMDI